MKKILYWNAHNNSNLKNINFIQNTKTEDTFQDRKWKNNIYTLAQSTPQQQFFKKYILYILNKL
jgi:hypothetical protein